MWREKLGAAELRALYRRTSIGVAVVWSVGTLGLIASVVVLGDFRHTQVSDMPRLVNDLMKWVFLFPGLHAAVGVAWALGISPRTGWVNLSIFLTAMIISSAFWIGLIPWVLVAIRVYVWPWRSGRGQMEAEQNELKAQR